MMTLAEYFKEAGIQDVELWTHGVPIRFPEGREPMPHQITGLSQAAYHTRFGLFDEQGVGKTLVSHGLAIWYASMENKCVILMDPHLLDQYYTEFHEVFEGIEGHISMEIYRGTPVKRAKQRERWEREGFPDIILMTYNLFRMHKLTPKQIKDGGMPILMWRYLKTFGYSVLVADEATKLKTPSSAIHKACHQFLGREGESALLIMTGTPSENVLIDLYGLIRLTNPRAYGSKRNFERLHVVYNPYSDFPQIEGYKNLDLLSNNLYARGRRVEKKDVLPDLPDKTYNEYPVELDSKHMALYKKLAKERLLELSDRIIDAELEQALRQKMAEITYNPHLYSDTPIINEPLNTLAQLIESIGPQSNKIMIYIYRKATAELIMRQFEELNPVLVNSTTSNKRQHNITKFKDDPSCRLFVANYLSAGTGLNFQSVCSHAIFYEPISVPGKFFQATDRIHRGVMKSAANYYIVTPMNTVAVSTRNSMISKHQTNQQVTRDTTAIESAIMGKEGLVGSFNDLAEVEELYENLSDKDLKQVNFGGGF